MFRFTADRIPVLIILLFSLSDFAIYFLVDSVAALFLYFLLMVIPKGMICAWNHHHQHTPTFHAKPLNRLLEFFYALHTGATTNLWVLHHVLGHHRNFLNQLIDESRWKHLDGSIMTPLEYSFNVAGTAYYRGYQVGNKFKRVQREFVIYSALTFFGVIMLCWYKLMPGILIFALPMVISLLFTSWVTYDHHAGLDTEDQFEGSFNNTNRTFNLLTGNLGFHTAHHYRQGVHWSKLPALHNEIKHQIPQALIRDAMFVLSD